MSSIDPIERALTASAQLRDLTSNTDDARVSAAVNDLLAALSVAKTRGLRPRPGPLVPSGRKWGCYQFEEDDALYCTGCWDSKREKSTTNRVNSRQRSCPVCRALIGT